MTRQAQKVVPPKIPGWDSRIWNEMRHRAVGIEVYRIVEFGGMVAYEALDAAPNPTTVLSEVVLPHLQKWRAGIGNHKLLLEALRYAHHLPDCLTHLGQPCTCGKDYLKREIEDKILSDLREP